MNRFFQETIEKIHNFYRFHYFKVLWNNEKSTWIRDSFLPVFIKQVKELEVSTLETSSLGLKQFVQILGKKQGYVFLIYKYKKGEFIWYVVDMKCSIIVVDILSLTFVEVGRANVEQLLFKFFYFFHVLLCCYNARFFKRQICASYKWFCIVVTL